MAALAPALSVRALNEFRGQTWFPACTPSLEVSSSRRSRQIGRRTVLRLSEVQAVLRTVWCGRWLGHMLMVPGVMFMCRPRSSVLCRSLNCALRASRFEARSPSFRLSLEAARLKACPSV